VGVNMSDQLTITVNGGTDLIVEMARQARCPRVLINASWISRLDDVCFDNGVFYLGAGVSAPATTGASRP
jgi:hypothetical protein